MYGRKVIVHEIQSSRPSISADSYAANEVLHITSPRPNASFFSLKDYDEQCTQAYARAMKIISSEIVDEFVGVVKN